MNKKRKLNHPSADDIMHKLNIINMNINNIHNKINNINNRLTQLENNFDKFINIPKFKSPPSYFY